MVKIALLLIMSTIRTKQDAIRIFGGTMKAVGDALGISRQAVYQWPEELPQDTSDRLVGAAIRLTDIATRATPEDEREWGARRWRIEVEQVFGDSIPTLT